MRRSRPGGVTEISRALARLPGEPVAGEFAFSPMPVPDEPAADEAPKPHHLGHRDRLRERARKGGLAALPDYELLEIYLFRSIPMRDVKPLAKALLTRFGSLSGVLAASKFDLRGVAGVGGNTALDLMLLHEMNLRVGREPITKRTVISSWSQLLSYVRVALANEPREQFRVLFLDR
jgi:DNA repair protein RadC